MDNSRRGPLAALMDEYLRAAEELIEVVSRLEPRTYEMIVDQDTTADCDSVRSIAMHTLGAAYAYANAIRRELGLSYGHWSRHYPTQAEYPDMLRDVISYTEEAFADKWSMTDEQMHNIRIPVRWSDRQDLETLLQHAIVHILRHRRQIERLTAELPPTAN